ncbi:MAG TPA: hypothetical protein VIM51_00430 [Desulfosporosinus sp.]
MDLNNKNPNVPEEIVGNITINLSNPNVDAKAEFFDSSNGLVLDEDVDAAMEAWATNTNTTKLKLVNDSLRGVIPQKYSDGGPGRGEGRI